MRIDLSADVGEGADDLPIFPLVTSVSVACGAHAGDRGTMERCVAEAKRLGVAVGAHPGYPDRDGFGRRSMTMSETDVHETLLEQIGTLDEVCSHLGMPLRHVKPHGALYNLAAVDPSLAATIARAVRTADPALRVVGLAGSALVSAAVDAGLRGVAEAFADRRYLADGTLAPRNQPGALIIDPEAAAAQALALARGEPVATLDGPPIRIEADTLCLHADTPGALESARLVRASLEMQNVDLAPIED